MLNQKVKFNKNIDNIVDKIIKGNRRTLAKLIRLVEDEDPISEEILKKLYPHTGNAYVIGITGSPGVGKSTIIDKLIEHYIKEGKKVGVIAVDPTSPISGGAILGDRIRMQRHSTNDKCFIRSFATRGHIGGLTKTIFETIQILDAGKFDIIIMETVGVGQDEIEVKNYAHTVIVTLIPGAGDEIQSIKAGLMEIADIFVLNKSDHPAKNRALLILQEFINLLKEHKFLSNNWEPKLVSTIATTGEGIDKLTKAIEEHRNYIFSKDPTALLKRKEQQAKFQIKQLLHKYLVEYLLIKLEKNGSLKKIIDGIVEKKVDPYTAVLSILNDLNIKWSIRNEKLQE